MTFSQIPYRRPALADMERDYAAVTARLRAAPDAAAARAAFLDKDRLTRRVQTQATLAEVRHSIDNRDRFYDEEANYWSAAAPQIEAWEQTWTKTLLASPHRPALEGEYGALLFQNAQIALRSFSPALIEPMQRENELCLRYDKLLACAEVPFEGRFYTLAQMTPFKTDPDDARRLAAWKAEGQWYRAHQGELDEIYDGLVRLRHDMARRLGHENYIPLGYDRMGRNCYDQRDVERFRAAVVRDVVPLSERIFRRQAQRLGVAYPLSFADAALSFRSGNPRPAAQGEALLEAGQRFYDELSPETGAFFRLMRERELLDVMATEGKQSGGYCTQLWDEAVPFIFSNFNGTQGDVEVITHEAGHAFSFYLNRHRVPCDYAWPTAEACEVHSMSMEYFGERSAETFFGADADKFRYAHLSAALTFLPYGAMVDHFQHIVYQNPDFTPARRHEVWRELLGVYMPWLRLDGEIPVYGEGCGWQRQIHIYQCPFYYIDYCLASAVALQFWAMLRRDPAGAWETYLAYTRQGGSRTFTDLLSHAGLKSPFTEDCLRQVCAEAGAYLDAFPAEALV